ncbi:hypothetical protein Poli38472_002436 [Pythium oligandrum]|uniref:Uncharacterized protein n=1 Tax=Pythium oligandrum TaxID=41045 RepID=A0A8K1FH44_PYTOL|nr:hypothetical protein Poli38472_002436 [Pythium oligandrum]|eukprot:TMW63495.1 hypothetical protein Poli38472_002436 [Pythium oligandrum]
MTHSNSDSSLPAIEYFRAQQDSHIEGIKTFVSEQRDKRIHLLHKTNLSKVLRQELEWQVDKDSTSDTTCIMDAEEESEPKGGDQPLDVTSTDGTSIEPPEEEEVVEEQPPLVVDESVDHTTDEDLLLETVASAVYELVDMVVIHVEEEEREPVEAWIVPEKRRSTVMDLTRFIVRIQSTYRGHRARRAFRLALYQEALSCGVLGAMPGTFQGQSGWYQDPKTLMAYYFKIQPDGEWKQKIVLRCNSLILTPYQMHEEILSKVFIDSE